jgi:hypothetical protein
MAHSLAVSVTGDHPLAFASGVLPDLSRLAVGAIPCTGVISILGAFPRLEPVLGQKLAAVTDRHTHFLDDPSAGSSVDFLVLSDA